MSHKVNKENVQNYLFFRRGRIKLLGHMCKLTNACQNVPWSPVVNSLGMMSVREIHFRHWSRFHHGQIVGNVN